MESAWKPFRFQLIMAARLILERMLMLDPNKRRSQAYCNAIDAVMSEPDEAQKIFDQGAAAIQKAINTLTEQGGARDRRTAKMKDMRDSLRRIIAE
jgi:hypothetical protein